MISRLRFYRELSDTRKKALLAAVRHHGTLTKQAMIGEGVDRHLFALYIASVGLKLDSDFLSQYKNARWTDSKLSGWELSTRYVYYLVLVFFNIGLVNTLRFLSKLALTRFRSKSANRKVVKLRHESFINQSLELSKLWVH